MVVKTTRPVIGIPASVRYLEYDMPFHGTAQQYLRAVREEVDATVFTIPGLQDESNAMELLELVDGVLLTGSFSNIHPSTYGHRVSDGAGFFDSQRDAVTLPLIRAALERGVPLFGICRGLQEINVALGGTLHQSVHNVAGRSDHRSDAALPLEDQFDAAHDIEIAGGGAFASLIRERHISVNSSHTQAIDRLAPGLRVEAVSLDGTIEAVSAVGETPFFVGVQFHPEWGTGKNVLYAALFRAFRDAVRERHAARHGAGAGAPPLRMVKRSGLQ